MSLIAAAAACSGSDAPPEVPPGCNPIVGDDCMTPFPSSFHEAADASTATGMRVAIHDATGRPLAPAPFLALRDKPALNAQLAALAPAYEQIFAALESAGLARKSLTLAWDVTTASDADTTGHLVHMRDEALALAD